MAAVCDICAKKPGFGNNRPWSRKITKRRFNPNIQRVRATVNGSPKRVNVCTGCLKAGKVTVKVLPTHDRWFGVTYQEDKPVVIESFARLIEAGVYRKDLFSDLKQ